MRTWHDIESYPSMFQTGTCRNANYALGEVVDVLNTQVLNQTLDVMRGIAVPSTNDSSAKLDVSFPIAGTNGKNPSHLL
jgi:retinol-binding protein 4